MTFVPFGEWLPDQPDFNNPGAATIQNVIPLTAQSYGPMPTPQVVSSALGNRCQGAYAFVDKSAAVNVFAGDSTKLYRYTAGSAPSFADISGATYTTPSPITPLIPTAPAWSMTSFGERIIATNYSDPIQTFLLGTDSAFSNLAAAAPKARYAAVIRDFLMVANTNDAVSGVQPRRVWWPAIGNPLSWPTPGTNAAIQVESDYQDLEQSDLGQITGLVGGHLAAADGAVFCERGIYRVAYVGSSGGIFAFGVAQGAAGTIAPLSIIPHRMVLMGVNRAVAFYLGEDDFYAFDGQSSVPLGAQKIAQTFFSDLSPSYQSTVLGGAVPNRPLVFWLYTSVGGAATGLYDRLLIFNTTIQRWALCDITATPAEWATRSITPGLTLDALDIFGSLDAVPAPLDSNLWAGGSAVLAPFDSAHKLNVLNGPPMAPIVETSEFQPSPGRRTKILSARPICSGAFGAPPFPSIAIATRDRMFDSVVYHAAIPANVIGECPQRTTGRYVRARLTIPAGVNFTHLQGVDVDVRPEGRR